MTDDGDAAPLDRSPQLAGDEDELGPTLRRLTAARIGLKRTGASLATEPLLEFQLAHARARDAVHEPLDEARLIAELAPLGLSGLAIASAAENRQSYSDAARPRPPPWTGMRGHSRHALPTAMTLRSSSPMACRHAPCRCMRRRSSPAWCRRCAPMAGGSLRS